MNTHHNPQPELVRWERDVSGDFHKVMNLIRRDPAPPSSVDRFMTAAIDLDERRDVQSHGTRIVRQLGNPTSETRRWPLLASVAALLLAAVGMSFFQFSQPSAWAQVIQVVREKPWMRLTLQKPDGEIPEGETLAEVTMWFSGDRRFAALKSPPQMLWVDTVTEDRFEFRRNVDRIVQKKLFAGESLEIQRLMTALAPFDAGRRQVTDSSLALQKISETDVTIDGTTYIDFAFQLQNADRAEAAGRLIVRVNKATRQPVRMTMREAVFAIDYPESGPTDIYALGIPKNIPVDDLRQFEKFFPDRSSLVHDDYEAVEVMVIAGMEGRWINEAKRYRSQDGKATCEYADLEQVNRLANVVYFAGGDSPTGTVHDMNWWITEAGKLDFKPSQLAGYNFPHNRCYAPYGGVEAYRSADVSTLKGLEGMIELRGPKLSVWLDPERDWIVRRMETVDDNGTISVAQYDNVIQDSKGVWHATQWRKGQVSERSGLLPEKLTRDNTGVASTIFFAEITFKK